MGVAGPRGRKRTLIWRPLWSSQNILTKIAMYRSGKALSLRPLQAGGLCVEKTGLPVPPHGGGGGRWKQCPQGGARGEACRRSLAGVPPSATVLSSRRHRRAPRRR